MNFRSRPFITVYISVTLLLVGYLLPEQLVIPVDKATQRDWNHATFWHYPWGKSGVHKGIDIFAPTGTAVISSSYGVVIFKGELALGGKVVAVLGPKWRVHYYAHLNDFKTGLFDFVHTGETVGTVGKSGNAINRPPHLHYAVVSILPQLWRWDGSRQGWKKIFFLNPSELLLRK